MARSVKEKVEFTGYNTPVPCRDGVLIVNRHDRYVGKSLVAYGEFSKGEGDLFRKLVQPSDIVIEGGANIGAHTVTLSRLARAVFAFEPQRLIFQTLCANLALNSITNVHAIHAALGRKNGDITFPALDPDADNNFGGLELKKPDDPALVTESAPLVQLDSLADIPVTFIKLDLEGMELDALRGGGNLIARHRPVLYVEDDRETQSGPLHDWLRENDFDVRAHQPPLYAPDNWRDNPENVWGSNIVSRNLLCVPKERVERYAEVLSCLSA